MKERTVRVCVCVYVRKAAGEIANARLIMRHTNESVCSRINIFSYTPSDYTRSAWNALGFFLSDSLSALQNPMVYERHYLICT